MDKDIASMGEKFLGLAKIRPWEGTEREHTYWRANAEGGAAVGDTPGEAIRNLRELLEKETA